MLDVILKVLDIIWATLRKLFAPPGVTSWLRAGLYVVLYLTLLLKSFPVEIDVLALCCRLFRALSPEGKVK